MVKQIVSIEEVEQTLTLLNFSISFFKITDLNYVLNYHEVIASSQRTGKFTKTFLRL